MPPDGAHILPRKPYSKLADKIWNIIPLQNKWHRRLDTFKKNDFIHRLKYLWKNCLPEYKSILKVQIGEVIFNLIKENPVLIEDNIFDLITNDGI